ncbi:MAG: virginiamycin B lyase family protein [Solirubrobacteraceae bacterium]
MNGAEGAWLYSPAKLGAAGRRRMRRGRLLAGLWGWLVAASVLAGCVSLAGPAAIAAAASPGTVAQFPLPTAHAFPDFIATGPNNAVWVTENQAFRVAEVSMSGVITEFSVPADYSELGGITEGTDGNLWSAEWTDNGSSCGGEILRMTPAGRVTSFPLAGYAPGQLTAGPDGNVWFTTNACGSSATALGRITPLGAVTMFPLPTNGYGITTGPDSNLWVAMGGSVARVSTAGAVTAFPVGPSADTVTEITTGPDGNLWFTDFGDNRIGMITPSGVSQEWPLAGAPFGIAAGPTGTLIVSLFGANAVDQVDTSGNVLSSSTIPAASSGASQIVAGPDGNFWFAEQNANAVGRFSLLGGTATAVTMTKSPSVSEFGQSVTLTAAVSPNDGGGVVSFSAQGQSIGCLNEPLHLVGGSYEATCTTSELPYGRYPVIADYSGDSTYAPSAGSLDQFVIQANTTLTAQPISIVGALLTTGPKVTATLISRGNGAGVPGQLISFNFQDGTSICRATTDASGVATCTGAFSLLSTMFNNTAYRATYDGTVNYGASDASASVSLL